MPGCAAATCGRSVGAVRLQVRGEARGGRFCFDVSETWVVLMLRGPHLLTQTHPQVADVGEIKIHIEGVGSPGISEKLIHSRRAVSERLLLVVCGSWKGKRLRGEVPVHLTLCLRIKKSKAHIEKKQLT